MLDNLNNPYLISLITSLVIVCLYLGYNKYLQKEKTVSFYIKIFMVVFVVCLGSFLIKGDIKLGNQKGGGIENNIQIGDPGF